MSKKSQIAVFLLLGILLVIAVVLFAISMDKSTSQTDISTQDDFESGIKPVQNMIELCLESTATEALMVVGARGGYYELPTDITDHPLISVALWFKEGKSIGPSRITIANQISKYIDDYLSDCVKSFAPDFPQYSFDMGKSISKTRINDASVAVTTMFPLTVNQQARSKQISQFGVLIESIRLGVILDAIDEIQTQQKAEPELVCTSCLLKTAAKYGVYIDTIRLDPTTVSFTLTDYKSVVNDLPYQFTWAHKYHEFSCDYLRDFISLQQCLKMLSNVTELAIDDIPPLTAKVGQPFTYTIPARGEGLTFTGYNSLVNVDPRTGLCSYTPESGDIEDQVVIVKVEDAYKNTEVVRFVVTIADE